MRKLAKHELWELKQMQSLRLSAKIRMTQTRIKGWYEEFDGNVYVARSGGKDSDVLGHIVKKMYPDVPHIFVNTGLEFDSVRIHGAEVADEVLRPKMSFVQVITKYGYPIAGKEISKRVSEYRKAKKKGNLENCLAYKEFNGLRKIESDGKSFYNKEKWKFLLDAPFRISHKCCIETKEKPSLEYENRTCRKPYLGTMATESKARETSWLKTGCNAFESKRPTSQPLSFWTEQDILTYIHTYIRIGYCRCIWGYCLR